MEEPGVNPREGPLTEPAGLTEFQPEKEFTEDVMHYFPSDAELIEGHMYLGYFLH